MSTLTVTLTRVAVHPPVYVATCSCGAKTEPVGEQLYAVQLWERHAETAGHEGNYELTVVEQ